jgi:hypothetical protein
VREARHAPAAARGLFSRRVCGLYLRESISSNALQTRHFEAPGLRVCGVAAPARRDDRLKLGILSPCEDNDEPRPVPAKQPVASSATRAAVWIAFPPDGSYDKQVASEWDQTWLGVEGVDQDEPPSGCGRLKDSPAENSGGSAGRQTYGHVSPAIACEVAADELSDRIVKSRVSYVT